MLEIIALIGLCRAVGAMMRKKARNPLWLQVLTVVLWFGGELSGFVVAAIFDIASNGGEPTPGGPGAAAYLAALCGAAAGAGIALFIAWVIPPAEPIVPDAEVAEVFD